MTRRLPLTRGDCVDGPRPCPHTTCRYSLHRKDKGARRRSEFGPESCALDLAERDGMTLEEIGEVLGTTRERVRQIEETALAKLRDARALADFEHHTPLDDYQNWTVRAGHTDHPFPGRALPIVRFAADGDDEEWCERMWRSYTRGDQ